MKSALPKKRTSTGISKDGNRERRCTNSTTQHQGQHEIQHTVRKEKMGIRMCGTCHVKTGTPRPETGDNPICNGCFNDQVTYRKSTCECGAMPGDPCYSRTGRTRPTVHVARIKRLKEQQEDDSEFERRFGPTAQTAATQGEESSDPGQDTDEGKTPT